jgi:hypothetical protein
MCNGVLWCEAVKFLLIVHMSTVFCYVQLTQDKMPSISKTLNFSKLHVVVCEMCIMSDENV